LIHLRPQVVEGCDIKVAITPQLVHDIFDEYPSSQRHTTRTCPSKSATSESLITFPCSASHSLHDSCPTAIFLTLPKLRLSDLTSSRCELESAASSCIFDQDFLPACGIIDGVIRLYHDTLLEKDSPCARDRVRWAAPLGEEAALGTLTDGGYSSRTFLGDEERCKYGMEDATNC
jgi:hypothetical protein